MPRIIERNVAEIIVTTLAIVIIYSQM